jgi:thiamine-phosphate diphosphorylase
MAAPFDLCVITSRSARFGRGHLDVAQAALDGGCRFLQLRDKELSSRALLDLGRQMRQLCREYQAVFVVNDRLDIAFAAEADGVHLGQDDLPIAEARRLLGPKAIVGASASTAEAARRAEAEGASYLGVGPVYATASKDNAGAAIGLSPISDIKANISLPVLAIGGINRDNMSAVIGAGADGVAVISAVSEAEDMVSATAGLIEAIRAARKL